MADPITQPSNDESPPSVRNFEEEGEKAHSSADDESSASDAESTFSESRHLEGQNSISLSRTATLRLDRIETTASHALATIRSRIPRPPFSHPLEHQRTTEDVLVDFDGEDDPYKPINWMFRKKLITTMLYGLTTMTVTLASSIFSAATAAVAEEFHVAVEVSTLGTALFLFGLAAGPLLFAPLSEIYGRKPAVLIPTFIGGCFTFGTAAAKDLQTIFITRFFQGVFGSAPVTNTGGVLADIWSPKQRGAAIVGYALFVVGGPTLGPIIGSALVINKSLGWRWTEYISGIFTMFILGLDVLILDESYPPALLVAKARRLRLESGNWALHAKHEEWNPTIAGLAHKYLIRPFQILVTPIGFLIVLYSSFCYGLLYGMLGALPIEFVEIRGYNQFVGSLPFLALLIGSFLGGAANFSNQRVYIKHLEANNGRPVPEARLYPMCFGSVAFAVGLFIFAWTSDKKFTWVAPCVGILLCGFGFETIFQGAVNYLIDTFQRYGASAVAANTFIRSAFAGAFPLFIVPMLHNLGLGWGLSVFGFFAILLLPVPFLFLRFGKRIRARGDWSHASTLWSVSRNILIISHVGVALADYDFADIRPPWLQ